MTNAELIQKIRAEIERRIEESRTRQKNLEVVGQRDANIVEEHIRATLKALLSFLSTLEESEKPMNQEGGVEEELDKWRHEHFHGKRDDHFSGEYLERTSQLELARHFAQWGSEHLATSGKTSGGSSEIPNFNELADYSRKQAEELLIVVRKYEFLSEELAEELRTHFMSMFLEGTVWQNEQMMKKAVPFYEILKVVPPGPERDKVKLIICKED